MLSLYKLEIFAAVVRAGSFSAAATQLYMTQPAVSQHIQDLENSLGTSLFIRGRRGVTMTSAGEILFDYTTRILQLVAEAESQVTNVENLTSGQLNIGATPGVSTYLLPDWLHNFRQKYPQLNVALHTGVTGTNVNNVMDHKIDLAFVEGELDKINRKGLGYLILRPVDMLVVVGQAHEWAQRESLTLPELTDKPFITRQPNSRTRVWVDAVLAKHKVKPKIIAEYDNQEAIKQSVMSNMALTILPDYAIHREIDAGLMYSIPVEDVDLSRELKLLYDATMPFTPVARALLQHLADLFPQLTALLD